ncbi:hypothetical protein CMQ_5171 [Grosmannia clavigera kw1407]|uniref:Uncharacterized protein n=1 Tax=Grosmannia clavigera (strain kw1407 / UAMH 11150) TaxID=655863 RepID=F0XB92_GROCL|nr:uncharacterized protein CMQ_5171 [Grosmannia clavigera kw1407]EFX04909.1 hypothetical protein CMQ_5171 [Grosmannia clavigera kw1407]
MDTLRSIRALASLLSGPAHALLRNQGLYGVRVEPWPAEAALSYDRSQDQAQNALSACQTTSRVDVRICGHRRLC